MLNYRTTNPPCFTSIFFVVDEVHFQQINLFLSHHLYAEVEVRDNHRFITVIFANYT
jgi:hypothetical protein